MNKWRFAFSISFILVCIGVAGLNADPLGLSLRISGGYGFSMNSTTTFNSGGEFVGVPLSSGTPASVEVLYSITSNTQVGLGVFPVFMTRGFTVPWEYPVFFSTIPETVNFYPVLASVYFRQPIGSAFEAFAGFGVGVVPSTSITFDDSSSNQIPLFAALAFRGALGMDWKANQNFRIGADVQDLMFDQETSGWGQITSDFNQWAPMGFVEWDI